MIIAIDFDGTCVTHEFPEVGRDIGAVPVLKRITEEGHELILWTMRSHPAPGTVVGQSCLPSPLDDAINWFSQNGIPLWGVNKNPQQKTWTQSPKAYAQIYIDDAALSCPLVRPADGRPYVDWSQVLVQLIQAGVVPPKLEDLPLLTKPEQK